MPVPTSDTAATARGLARWVATDVAGIGDTNDVEVALLPSPRSTGYSCETVLFDATWRLDDGPRHGSFAARIQPSSYSLFAAHDLGTQWRLIDALHRHTDLPLPGIIGHQTGGTSVLDRPFFVMERIDGVVPSDYPPYAARGWLAESTPEQQGRVYWTAFDMLARLHQLDWRALGLEFLSPQHPAGDMTVPVQQYGEFLRWALSGRRVDLYDHAYGWLVANAPRDDGPPVLNWGDARLGNIIFRDWTPVALLDWEMATIGPGESDLGWWFVLHRVQTLGRGLADLPGFPTEAEAVARYERRRGRHVRHLQWYLVWAALRAAVLLHRATDLMVESGALPADRSGGPDAAGDLVLADVLGGDDSGPAPATSTTP